MQVNKAVFPVAGLGTRLLPITKANHKEMLAVVDKPMIHYVVAEAIQAGIKEIIFVTNQNDGALRDYFSPNYALEKHLREQGKLHLLDALEQINGPDIKYTFLYQEKPLGLGNAVLCAEDAVDNEPFAVLLPDVLTSSAMPCMAGMCEQFNAKPSSIIAVVKVDWSQVGQYGIVKTTESQRIHSIIEKPAVNEAPSNLAVLGRYILTPAIFSYLKQTNPDERAEIQLTDGIAQLLKKEEVYAFELNEAFYDCGMKLGYLQTIVEFGLQHPEIGREFRTYLQQLNIQN